MKPIIEKPNSTQQQLPPQQKQVLQPQQHQPMEVPPHFMPQHGGHHPGRTSSQPPIQYHFPQENFQPIHQVHQGMGSSYDQGGFQGRFSFDNLMNSPPQISRAAENEFIRRSNVIPSQGVVIGDQPIRKSAIIEMAGSRQIYGISPPRNEIPTPRLSPSNQNSPPLLFGGMNGLRRSYIVDGPNNNVRAE